MTDNGIALARLRHEMERPPFHHLLRPKPLEIDLEAGTVAIGLKYRSDLARAPEEAAFHGGVIAALIDLAGHAAVAVKINRMAPTIDLRIDYLRASKGNDLVARARLLKAGRTVACVDIEVSETDGGIIAVGRGTYSTQ